MANVTSVDYGFFAGRKFECIVYVVGKKCYSFSMTQFREILICSVCFT